MTSSQINKPQNPTNMDGRIPKTFSELKTHIKNGGEAKYARMEITGAKKIKGRDKIEVRNEGKWFTVWLPAVRLL